MSGAADAAAQVDNDQIQLLIRTTQLLGRFKGHGPDVFHMAHVGAGDLRDAGELVHGLHLVGGAGVVGNDGDLPP